MSFTLFSETRLTYLCVYLWLPWSTKKIVIVPWSVEIEIHWPSTCCSWAQLLLALVSAYRYEGSEVRDDNAKSEAKTLSDAIKNAHDKAILEDEEVILMLGTRSKPHLQAVLKHYKEICGNNLDEVLDTIIALQSKHMCYRSYIVLNFSPLRFFFPLSKVSVIKFYFWSKPLCLWLGSWRLTVKRDCAMPLFSSNILL